jgi:uncharacterized OsmC-like protein
MNAHNHYAKASAQFGRTLRIVDNPQSANPDPDLLVQTIGTSVPSGLLVRSRPRVMDAGSPPRSPGAESIAAAGESLWPPEGLLVALGACATQSFLRSCVAQGVSVSELITRLRASAPIGGRGALGDIEYVVHADVDAERAVTVMLAEHMARTSPVHLMILGNNSLRLSLDRLDDHGSRIEGYMSAPLTLRPAKKLVDAVLRAEVTWRNGTPIRVALTDGEACALRRISFGDTSHVGSAGGLKPQEILLSALNAEVLHGLHRRFRRSGIEVSMAACSRALFDHVVPDQPRRMRDFHLHVDVRSDIPLDFLTKLIHAAVESSVTAHSICSATPISAGIRGVRQEATGASDEIAPGSRAAAPQHELESQ